jgi:YHS domain-containing protein
MKTLHILTIFTASIFLAISCTKENKSEVKINVADENHAHHSANQTLDVKVVNELDPICGMENSIHLKDTANYKGKTYGFCNTMCKEKFLETPEEYLNE